MKIALVRDKYLNPWDIGNYYGVINNGAELVVCGSTYADLDRDRLAEMYPNAKFLYYEQPHQVFFEDPDIIDVPDMFYDISRYFLSRFYRTVVVAWDNLPGRNYPHRYWWDKAAMVAARSTAAKASVVADGCPESVPIEVIYGAVDTELFCGDSERDGSILFCGRLVAEKGLMDLLWALSGSSYRLKVIGAGDPAPYIEAAKRYRVDASFYGEIVDRRLLAQIFNASSLFCVPSLLTTSTNPDFNWAEQFGQVFVEAMAAGLPIVGYFTGAVPEVVGPAGYLEFPRSFVGLRQNIDTILTNPDLWETRSRISRERALKHFSQDVIGGQIVAAYSRLID